LPQRFPPAIGTEALIALTRRDKKVRDGQVRYAFPRSLGRMAKGGEVTVPVADELVRSVLNEEPPPTA
jgi:3-dehydroquinate synthetase